MTKIHAEYWSCANIPILLVAFIPENHKIYWIEINNYNIQKTNVHSKIEIPKKNEINYESLKIFSEIIFRKKDNILEKDFNYFENKCVEEANKSKEIIINFSAIIVNFGNYCDKSRENIDTLVNFGFRIADKEIIIELSNFQKLINPLTIEVYKNLNKYLFHLSKALHYYLEFQNNLDEKLNFYHFIENIDYAIFALTGLNSKFNQFYNSKYPKNFTNSLKLFQNSLEIVLKEIEAAKIFVIQFSLNINN